MNVVSLSKFKASIAGLSDTLGTVAFVTPAGGQAVLASVIVSRDDTATATYDEVLFVYKVTDGTVGSTIAVSNSDLIAVIKCSSNDFDLPKLPSLILNEGQSIAIRRGTGSTATGVAVVVLANLG